MKALWIASWYPNRHSPFYGDFVQRMAEATSPYCSLAVLSVVEGDTDRIAVEASSERFLEVLVYIPRGSRFSWFPPLAKATRAGRYIAGFWKGLKYVKKYFGKPDLLHLHVIFPAGLFVLLHYFLFRTPFLITEHWTGYRKASWGTLKWYQRWLGRVCTRLACYTMPVLPALAADMEALGFRGKYAVLPNVVDINLFKPLTNKPLKSKFRFIHISNMMDKFKNISGILDAVSELAQHRKDFELYLVGDGPDIEALKNKAKNLGLSQLVTFVGGVEHELVSREMQHAECLLLFSNYENLPCVILEAMAVGIPIIAAETGGIREWVKSGVGFVVEPGDKNALVAAMERTMDSRADFDPEFIRSVVIDKCSYEVVGKKIMGHYLQVLNTSC